MATLNLKDIDDIVNEACNRQFASYLSSNKVRLDASYFTASLVGNFIPGIPDTTMAFLTGATFAHLVNSVVRAYQDTLRFAKKYRMSLLTETPEYKKCKRLYDEYIKAIAEFMRSIGIDDSLDVGMLYMEMLYGGFISAPGTFKYHRYVEDYDTCSPVMGARVASGQAVCRHIASSLVDLYRELGYTAAYLSVKGTRNDTMSIIKGRILPFKSDHAVVMIGDTYGKYIIDPTWGTVAVFGESSEFAKIVYNRKRSSLYHIDKNKTIEFGALEDVDDFVKLRMMDSASFGKGVVKESHDYAIKYVLENAETLEMFRNYFLGFMREIAKLECILSGYSDKRSDKHVKRLIKG